MGKGRLGIGASSTVSTYLLPSLLRRYKDRYPQIELSVKTDYGFKIIEAVRTRRHRPRAGRPQPQLAGRPRPQIPPGVPRPPVADRVWPGHEWCGRSLVEPRELTRGHF
jgi:DNA-binding transcriptional LysR family regulator